MYLKGPRARPTGNKTQTERLRYFKNEVNSIKKQTMFGEMIDLFIILFFKKMFAMKRLLEERNLLIQENRELRQQIKNLKGP